MEPRDTAAATAREPRQGSWQPAAASDIPRIQYQHHIARCTLASARAVAAAAVVASQAKVVMLEPPVEPMEVGKLDADECWRCCEGEEGQCLTGYAEDDKGNSP